MRKFNFFQLPIIFVFTVLLSSCENERTMNTSSKNNTKQQERVTPVKETQNEETETFDMTNPAFMMGTNIGSIFKTYYKVGDFNKMITYTASSTIKKYGRDKLLSIYRSLDLGYDMKFKNMTTEGNEKILHYEVIINATKQVKRLHVVIENDTARIIPQHLENRNIFE
jgi:hypothetical protein